MQNTVLVTGSAGFIGYHLSLRLLSLGHKVIGVDNLNDYYDVNLKKDRLAQLELHPDFSFYEVDIADNPSLQSVFDEYQIEYVVNLAAQAGVRYSMLKPANYINSNLVGFSNILEICKSKDIKHLVFASSSSVYGANTKMPFNADDTVDHPISLYAATKKSNELIAHSYAANYNMSITGLRFFTVYGTWSRPDMALFLFTKAILDKKPIDVYNHGNMKRDFTYVDDIVEALVRVIFKPAEPEAAWNSDEPKSSTSFAPYRIFNIGNGAPIELMDFIRAIEKETGIKAELNYKPIQKGDVQATYADTQKLTDWIDFKPNTSIDYGVAKFVEWYRSYYQR